MTDLRETTLGDIAGRAGRYRPFLLTLAGIIFVAALNARATDESSPTATGGAAFGGESADASQEGSPDGDTSSTTGTSAAPGSSPAARPGGAGLPSAPTGRGSASVPTVVSSADAAKAPDCDPSTSRIRIPSWPLTPPPNCVPVWPKGADNGGATFRGVTKDEIVVSIYQIPLDPNLSAIAAAAGATDTTSEEEDDANREIVLDAFRAHYETYGRKVRAVKVEPSGGVNDENAAKADAIRIASEIKAFANMEDPSRLGGKNTFVQELAARQVLCIPCTSMQPSWVLERYAPYVWNDRIAGDGLLTHTAELIGKRLGGGPAKWAGDPLLAATNRSFGLIHVNTADNTYAGIDKVLDRELAKYRMSITQRSEYFFDLSSVQEAARVNIARMKDAGVTSVVCWCDGISVIFFTNEATRQQYFPEWILTASVGTDIPTLARAYDQTQWAHAFGVGIVAPPVEAEEQNFVDWHCGCSLTSYPELYSWSLIFTGIHMAGPKLTPLTFRDAMFALKPRLGQLTRVGFSYGRHGLWPWTDYQAIDDTTEVWWDPNAPDGRNRGLYRFVDGGRRYGLGERPDVPARFFDPEGAVLKYAERPPQDRTPLYEHAGSFHRGQ